MSEVIRLCQELVRQESIGANVDSVLQVMQSYLQAHGFRTEILHCEANGKSMPALYATIGAGHKHLLFNGHLDVVPAGCEDSWDYPPFSAEVHDGVLYGRGIADMKGGVAAFVVAATNVKDFDGRISLLLSTDEEEPVVETTKVALAFLQERGEKFDFALVGEPTNIETMGTGIKVGRRGDVVLRVTSLGKQGHVAYPQLADNPIHHLIELLGKVKAEKWDEGNELFSPSSLQITTIDVGNSASNVIPEKAFAQIDVRFSSEQTSQKIIARVQELIGETDGNFDLAVEVVGESFLSPINQDVELLKKIVTDVCGRVPEYSTSGGTSDARFVRAYCPVAEFGLTNATIHKINEKESLENIELLRRVYQEFLEAYFSLS